MTDTADDQTYTDTELQALPQTTAVFDQPKLAIDEHEWYQQGYMIYDKCHNGLGISIPSGKMLIKREGKYDLVDELNNPDSR